MKLVVALGSLALASLAACGADTTGRYSQALTGPAPGECGEVENHLIGVYQTPNGDGTIYLDRKGKHVLTLSAHEKTTWHIKTAPDAVLEHVYAVGYHEQIVDLSEVNGTPSVLIDSMDKNQTAACGYSWPYDGQGCDTDGLLELAAARTQHDVNSFAGCYEASTWKIGNDMAATSDCATSGENESAAYLQTHFFSCDPADTNGQCGSGSTGGGGGGSGGGSSGGGDEGGGGSSNSGPTQY